MSDETYIIDIEIDADAGTAILTKGNLTQYTYTIEELEGKGVIDRALQGGAQLTVYSQGQRFTKEEYDELFGSIEGYEPEYLTS